jgi:glycosyltransferase involved in cell wall biosynthesis
VPRAAALFRTAGERDRRLIEAVRALLLSAYAAQSHRQWREALLQMFAEWDWAVLELPPRHFSWRLRGASLYWAETERAALDQSLDLVVATSMVDLATLRGLVPTLAATPTVLYFHENQFAYPPGRHRHGLLEAQLVSLYAALASDRLLFNSAYNRSSFLDGCAALLRRFPDYVPPGLVESLARRSDVVPVPCDIEAFAEQPPAWPGSAAKDTARPLRLLWVGRFEHDKGGDALLNTLEQLERDPFDYELAVVGQQFREAPAAFTTIAERFDHRIVHYGYLPSIENYRAVLAGADIVLSTAEHEFQGLAVMEAVAAGCVPAVPDGLAYREIYPAAYRYGPGEGDAAALLRKLAAQLRYHRPALPDLSPWSRTALAPCYAAAFARARDGHLSPQPVS